MCTVESLYRQSLYCQSLSNVNLSNRKFGFVAITAYAQYDDAIVRSNSYSYFALLCKAKTSSLFSLDDREVLLYCLLTLSQTRAPERTPLNGTENMLHIAHKLRICFLSKMSVTYYPVTLDS